MTRATAEQIDRMMNKTFEVQATIDLLGRRLEDIASGEKIDHNELTNLSRVTDLCVYTLGNVAELLELHRPKDRPVRERHGTDQLLALIAAYRQGLADFEQNSMGFEQGPDAYAAISYIPPMNGLKEWTGAAKSIEGAREALRIAVAEIEHFGDDQLVCPLVRAALDYLEGVWVGNGGA